MKKIKKLIASVMLSFLCFLLVGCGGPSVNITLGTYNAEESTFTAITGTDYTLEKAGETLTLKGTIPYSEGILGITAGNIVAIKITPQETITSDDATTIKTTNRTNESGWNTYGKEVLEEDGAIIWVTAVSKANNVQLKVKWNSSFEEITYTLIVDSSANLATA